MYVITANEKTRWFKIKISNIQDNPVSSKNVLAFDYPGPTGFFFGSLLATSTQQCTAKEQMKPHHRETATYKADQDRRI